MHSLTRSICLPGISHRNGFIVIMRNLLRLHCIIVLNVHLCALTISIWNKLHAAPINPRYDFPFSFFLQCSALAFFPYIYAYIKIDSITCFFSLSMCVLVCARELILQLLEHLTFNFCAHSIHINCNDLQNWRWHKTINGYEAREKAEKTHLNEFMLLLLLLSTRFSNRCWYAMFSLFFRFPNRRCHDSDLRFH